MDSVRQFCSHPFGCSNEIDPNGKIRHWEDARGVGHLLCEAHYVSEKEKAMSRKREIGKHKTARAHYEKYRGMAKRTGVSLLKSTAFGTKEQLERLYKADPLLNNIPLYRFDAYFVFAPRIDGGPVSLAENTCMYKHLLIYEVLGCVPEFVERS